MMRNHLRFKGTIAETEQGQLQDLNLQNPCLLVLCKSQPRLPQGKMNSFR